MKKRIPSVIMAVAGLLLLALFIFPLWRVTLLAPQYPDGVHLYIYINKIGGKEPGTLQNINILNHYIGMKPIVPESIPELTYLPIIILAFSLSALIVAFFNNKWLYLSWVLLFSIGCLIGLYDFYLWEYDYGHNLASNAPMKFEDTSFQPPLIGTKVLLNFVAKSFPHTGGYFAMGSLILASIAVFFKWRKP